VTVRAVVFDLDGVVRHFEPTDTIEADYGLEPGTLDRLPYEADLIEPAITGVWTYDEWVTAVGERLAQRFGEHTRPAAFEFACVAQRVDDAVLALVRRLRAHHTVALLTNGTTRVEEEVRALGIDGEFDHVFNSARIGYAKPDVRAFQHVLRTIGCEPHECVFTDDSELKLAGAAQLGIRTVHFSGAAALEEQLCAWDVRGAC
jgi:putative hydrolase of the HAD superfamily